MTEQASSIGIIGEPTFDERNERIKWFLTTPISSEQELEKELRKFKELIKEEGVNRVTARVFLEKKLSESAQIKEYKEAEITLNGKFNDFNLVYLGLNTKERKESRYLREAEVHAAKMIDREEKDTNYNESIERQIKKNIEIKVGNILDVDVTNILELYKEAYKERYTFGLNHENISSLLNNKNNIKAIAVDRDKVVSIGVAEVCNVKVGNENFRFAELSDAATYNNYSKQGLYGATSSALMKELAEQEVDLVYGEARSAHIGVNIVCRRTGRRFSGLLQKHCKISGPKDFNEISDYENLNVWAIEKKSLKNLVEEYNGD